MSATWETNANDPKQPIQPSLFGVKLDCAHALKAATISFIEALSEAQPSLGVLVRRSTGTIIGGERHKEIVMLEPASLVQEHYGSSDLVGRIMGALAAAGYDTSRPSVELFFPVDQLHPGGLNSTKIQAELAGVTKSMRVLDAGCGIGGSARFLAQTFGCQVEAVDLTSEYVETAAHLNALCRLEDKIVVRQGSVTELPYADETFDLVWCQNVTMNVSDKRSMFAEAYRVLIPGGRYTFTHAAQGPAGDPYYPLPWAREASYSFLGAPEDNLAILKNAGFVVPECRIEQSAGGRMPAAATDGLGPSIAMGADMPVRQANMARSLKEGRLVFMLVVAERPA